jgi:hypothetical protein
MAYFFAVEANRQLIGVDESQPELAIWLAAATAPVYQVLIGGLACDTFDPREFAAAVKARAN